MTTKPAPPTPLAKALRETAGPATVAPRELLDRAWAFDDPASYRAGVREAIDWMARQLIAGGDQPGSSSRQRHTA